MPFPIAAAVGAAKMAWNYLPEDMRLALRSDVKDFAVGKACGPRSLEEWGEAFSEAIDKHIEDTISAGDLKYAGGFLKFSMEEERDKFRLEVAKVKVAYELYFQNAEKKWEKHNADSLISKLFFTADAIEAIEKGADGKDGISFEIEHP